MGQKYYCLLVLLYLFSGCKERYMPELKETNERLLVVEGIISLGPVRTQIRLSRTVPVSEKGNRVPEVGAQVTIQSNTNEVFNLVHRTDGEYESAVLNLTTDKKYKLRIIAKGVEYATDFLEAKASPPIDDVSWEVKPNGLQLYVDTHDDSNKSKYYRWEFDDTWIFYAKYQSALIWDGNDLRLRNQELENIYKCWGNGISNAIVLGSSVKLSQDVIHKQPLVLIPASSEKLTERYSINVRQYTLTKEAFDFWENLRKNTESLGSIFDAQPSQLTGNVINVKNPKEPVLGYVSVGSVQQKRIFVSKTQLPNWRVMEPFECFPPDTLTVAEKRLFSDLNYIPLGEVYSDNGTLIGYTGTQRKCGDCTFRGTNRRPAFWQ